MATTAIVGGPFYNMLSLCPLFNGKEYMQPARNMFRDNVIVQDAYVQQANQLMSHRGAYGKHAATAEVVEVGGFRSTTTIGWGTFQDDISIFSDASAVPNDDVDIYGKTWMADEEDAKANFFLQSTENHLLYGTNGPASDTYIDELSGSTVTPTAAPQKYTGLCPRFRVPDNATGGNDQMHPDTTTGAQMGVWDGGAAAGGTNSTSIWFIRWGQRAASLITPFNDPQYGMKITDKGLIRTWQTDATTHQPTKFRDLWMIDYEWKHGLSIFPGENGGHHVARIRNIPTDLTTNFAFLKTTIFQIIEEYFLGATDGVMMYVPPRMRTAFDVLFEAKQNVIFDLGDPYRLSPDQWSGKVFVRMARSINVHETAVAAA